MAARGALPLHLHGQPSRHFPSFWPFSSGVCKPRSPSSLIKELSPSFGANTEGEEAWGRCKSISGFCDGEDGTEQSYQQDDLFQTQPYLLKEECAFPRDPVGARSPASYTASTDSQWHIHGCAPHSPWMIKAGLLRVPQVVCLRQW